MTENDPRRGYKPVNLSAEKHARATKMAKHFTALQPPGRSAVSLPEAFMLLIAYYEEHEGISLQ